MYHVMSKLYDKILSAAAELMKKNIGFVGEFLRLDAERKTADVSSQDLLAERATSSRSVV